jgi:hypothetical protein
MIGTALPRMLRLTVQHADLWNATFTSSERGTQNRVDWVPPQQVAAVHDPMPFAAVQGLAFTRPDYLKVLTWSWSC